MINSPIAQTMADREKMIANLRKKGLTSKQIARTLSITQGAVEHTAHMLLNNGSVDRLPRGPKQQQRKSNKKKKRGRKPPFWHNLNTSLSKKIISMRKRRETLDDIGKALGGKTKQWAQQIIRDMKALHGEEIFLPAPAEKLYTCAEAALEIPCSWHILRTLCESGEISFMRRGRGKGYLLTQQSIDQLREHPAITGEKTCVVCGETFICPPSYPGTKTCSPTCRDVRKNAVRLERMNSTPTLDTLLGWRKVVFQQLLHHKTPKCEEWITIREAAVMTGLTQSQIRLLKNRHIVSASPHPSRTWRGLKPLVMLARSEMIIVRDTVMQWQHQHNEMPK